MSTVNMLVELGNGYEILATFEVVDYCPGSPSTRWEEGEAEWISFARKVVAAEDLEECGIRAGQAIHRAYLTESLDALERRYLRERDEEAEYAMDTGGDWGDPYDQYWDR